MEEAKALGLALDSTMILRMRHSKNVIFGSQFLNDLTEINNKSSLDESQQNMQLMRKQSSRILDMVNTI
jgi:hypothetical protein